MDEVLERRRRVRKTTLILLLFALAVYAGSIVLYLNRGT
jgi:predicted nucleic acid-binding Zn ribbon protein